MKLAYPFDGIFPVTQRFGEKITDPKGHTGIDYALPAGTPVLAAADGTVQLALYSGSGYGNHIILKHAGNYQTVYAHLDTLLPAVGQPVTCGEVLGTSGNSGNSTGPHLHFELRRGRTAVDPEPFWERGFQKVDAPAAVIKPAAKTGDSGAEQSVWQVCCPVLHIRSGPGIRYPVCGRLNQGTTVQEFERAADIWIRIGPNRWAAARFDGSRLMEA